MEKWNRFLAERAMEINEATDEQIETVKIANIETLKDIPIQDYPFGDIFGDSYRIIEPLASFKKGSDVGKIVNMLAVLGWEVNTPTDLKYDSENRVVGGKIPCTKTKVTHFIDGKGKQGVSRKTITLDMYKCIDGIVKFINGGYKKVQDLWTDNLMPALVRWSESGGEDPELLYSVDSRIINKDVKLSKEHYRNLMKMFDACNYWLGMNIQEVLNSPVAKIESRLMDKGVYSRDLEQFRKTKLDSPKERYSLMSDFEAQMERHYLIFSRHPIDVYRMSDFEGLGSCHTPPGMPYYSESESSTFYNEHNICALAEAHGNGMIVYAVPVKEFQNFPPTQESLDKLDDQEIFYDENRPDADGELNPSARIRIKNVNHHDDGEVTALAVPSTIIYGAQLSGFKDLVMKKFAMLQKEKLSKIAGNKEAIFMNEFTRYGGSYQDYGHSVSDALPKMFSAAGVNLRIQGSSVMYDQDFENNIKQTFGQDQKAYINEKLNEIFDQYTGGGISFDWSIDENYEGIADFTWKMKVLMYFRIPDEILEDRMKLKALKDEVREIIQYEIPEYFPSDYYPISETDDITMGKTRDGKLMVLVGYPGCDVVGDYVCRDLNEALEDAVSDATRKMNQVFEVYAEDSGYNLIIHELEKRGHLPSETYRLQAISNEYGLENDRAQWPTEETEYKEHDYFGGEYLESITFKDSSSFYVDEILNSIEAPENLMKPAYTLIAQFLNTMEKSKEMTSKIVLGIEEWNPKEHPTISIEFLNPTVEVAAETIKTMAEEEDEIEYELTAILHNDYPSKVLKGTAVFLLDRGTLIDTLNDKIEEKLKQFITNNIKKQLTENKKRIKIRVRR